MQRAGFAQVAFDHFVACGFLRLAGLGVEAVAILFLNSYRNASHEARAKALIATNHPDMFVSASHELSREYREFERCSTVIANAYLGPKVCGYLEDIAAHLARARFGRRRKIALIFRASLAMIASFSTSKSGV